MKVNSVINGNKEWLITTTANQDVIVMQKEDS